MAVPAVNVTAWPTFKPIVPAGTEKVLVPAVRVLFVAVCTASAEKSNVVFADVAAIGLVSIKVAVVPETLSTVLVPVTMPP